MSDDQTKRIIIFTFCGVMVAVFSTMMIGLFRHEVDNDHIFAFVTHAFDLVLVSLTSYLGGRASAKAE